MKSDTSKYYNSNDYIILTSLYWKYRKNMEIERKHEYFIKSILNHELMYSPVYEKLK